MRDRERSYAAAPGAFRILALGDSFVEAYSVPLEDSVTQVLERSLPSSEAPIEVINGGTAGYSTGQEYSSMRRKGNATRRTSCCCSSITTTCSSTAAPTISDRPRRSSRSITTN